MTRDRVVSTSRRYKGHTDATRRRLDFDELSSSSSSSLSDDQPPEDHHQEQRYQPQQLEKADSATIYRPWEVSSKDMLALPGIFILSVLSYSVYCQDHDFAAASNITLQFAASVMSRQKSTTIST